MFRVEGHEGPLLLKGDTLIDRVQGKRFRHILPSKVLSGDVLAGEVILEDERRVPFIGDRLIDRVQGKNILEGRFLFELPSGDPVFLVKFEDGRRLLLRGNTLIERIGGEEIATMWIYLGIYYGLLPDGTLVGTAKLRDGNVVMFRGDDLLYDVRGKRIAGVGGTHSLPDGTVVGKLSCESKKDSLFWYKDEIHLPFLF